MVLKFQLDHWDIRIEIVLLAIYFALIPLENVLAASIGGSVNKYLGILAMGIIIFKHLRNGKISIRNYIPIICFFAFALMSFLWSIGADNSYLSILINMTFCTLVFIQVPLRKSEENLIFYSIVIAGVVLALMMLTGSRATAINTMSGGRMTLVFGGLMIDNNNLAVSISICAMVAFYLFYKSSIPFMKAVWIISFFLITIAIFYTGSRGGLLAEIVGLALYIWKAGDGVKFRTIFLGALAIILFGIIMQYFLAGGLASRFSIADVIASGGTGRTRIWGDALRSYWNDSIFRQLFGYGFGTFGKTQGMFWGHYTASHNDFVGILIELGVVGGILFILIWINLFKLCITEKNWIALSLLAVVFAGSLSIEMLIKKMLWLVWYFALVQHVKYQQGHVVQGKERL